MAGYCDNFSMIDGDSSNFSMIDGGDEFKAFPGLKGDDGTTFYPHVSAEGILSWTNDGGKPNPDPVNIKGADGKSAYQAAVEAGFSGTESEFNEYLSNIGVLTEEVAQQKSIIEALDSLVDRKAGMLVDTASGSIASFVPDSTIDNLLGVSVAVEPVQDLHGQASPWPAGGGKNLFNKDAPGKQAGYALDYNNGTTYQTSSGNYSVSDYIPVVAGQNYIASGNSKPTDYCWYDSGKTFISGGGDINTARTAPSNAAFLRIDYWKADENAVQLEAGSTATAYAPYENLCPISGWDAVGIAVCGTNLLDLSAFAARATARRSTLSVNQDNTLTVTCTESGQVWVGTSHGVGDNLLNDYTIPVNGGETIVLSSSFAVANFAVVEADAEKTVTRYNTITGAVTLQEGTRFIGLRFTVSNSMTAGDSVTGTFQVERGSQPTAFKPYTGNTHTITIGQTVYGGTLDVTNGTMTVEFACDSALWGDMTNSTINTNTERRRLNFSATGDGTRRELSSSNITTYINSTADVIHYQMAQNGTYAAFYLPLDTPANTQVQIRYPLATPVEIQIDPLTISAIAGQTNNVWADAGDVSVEFAADLKAYIDRLNQPTEDDMVANNLIASGKYFTINNRLFLSTASIAAGAQIIPGTNCTETSLAAALNALNA